MTQNNSRRPKKTQKSKVLPTDQPIDRPTDQPKDTAGYRGALSHLKKETHRHRFSQIEAFVAVGALEGFLSRVLFHMNCQMIPTGVSRAAKTAHENAAFIAK